jgi:hypothetical protein
MAKFRCSQFYERTTDQPVLYIKIQFLSHIEHTISLHYKDQPCCIGKESCTVHINTLGGHAGMV